MSKVLGFDPSSSATPALAEWQRQLIGSAGLPGVIYNLLRGGTAIYRGISDANYPKGQLGSDSGYPNLIPSDNPANYPQGQLGSDPVAGQLPINSQTNNPPMYGSGPASVGPLAGAGAAYSNPYPALSSYGQGTFGGYGGGSQLQFMQALRNSGLPYSSGGDTYSSPWQFAPGGGSGIPIGFGGVPLRLQY